MRFWEALRMALVGNSGFFVLAIEPTVIAATLALVASLIMAGAMIYITTFRAKRNEEDTDRIIQAAKDAAELLANVTQNTAARLETATQEVAAAIPPKATRDEPMPVEITEREVSNDKP